VGHAEIVYEDGSHSIVQYDDESELQAFLTENHRRVVNGEPSAPQDLTPRHDLDPNDPVFAGRTPDAMADVISNRPGFRVKRVFLYDNHPADLVPVGNDGNMPVKVTTVQELLTGMAGAESGPDATVNMHQLTQALRDEASPVYSVNPGKFESHYKMPETSELDLSFLDNNATPGTSEGPVA
jgi:hypothetical protein